jgi:hypothetical protein
LPDGVQPSKKEDVEDQQKNPKNERRDDRAATEVNIV